MPGKSDFLEALYLNLIFKGITNAAWAATAGSATNIYCSLCTADPGDTGTAVTNEVTTAQYPLYARVAIARGAGFTVSGSNPTSVSPAAVITFPTTNATGTGCTATHFAFVSSASGAGDILYSGAITPNIVIPATTAGVIPQLTTATAVTED